MWNIGQLSALNEEETCWLTHGYSDNVAACVMNKRQTFERWSDIDWWYW